MLKRGLLGLISSDFCEQPLIGKLRGPEMGPLVVDDYCHVVNEFDYDRLVNTFVSRIVYRLAFSGSNMPIRQCL